MGDRHKHYFLDSDMHYHKTKMPQFDTKDYEIRQELVSRLEIAYKDDFFISPEKRLDMYYQSLEHYWREIN